ncbi:hypothetical protein L0128_20925, partial [candidate division KSB1 bacterium]|nr:hypothetical protein [candidate division KSB1 bacterium]
MKLKNIRFLFIYLLLMLLTLPVRGDENRWVAIGMLHNWYSSGGCEVEVGRRHLIPDQQDGLRWPAQFQNQDCQAAKAMWIGVKNYNDALAQKTYTYKVVHVGPRVLDEENEFMPVTFKLIARTAHPFVTVDGTPACNTAFEDMYDEVDPSIKSDRMLLNVVNTAIGVTVTRKIYAFSQQHHNNYFIYDFVFTNTGIINKKGTVNAQTLTDVVFLFQYRYAPAREGGPYGTGYWLPQSACWGVNTMNDVIGQNANPNDPFRATLSWHGKHAGWGGPGDNIGAPKFTTDGHLGAQQYVGVLTIHADKSTTDNSDDPFQPTTTWYLDSDAPMTSGNDQFNADKMANEYQQMTKGHPPITQADAVGNEFADKWAASNGTNGGFSQTIGYGPYTLAPGESIHLVQAEAVAGLDRQSCYTIGKTWLDGGTGPFTLPNGTTT